ENDALSAFLGRPADPLSADGVLRSVCRGPLSGCPRKTRPASVFRRTIQRSAPQPSVRRCAGRSCLPPAPGGPSSFFLCFSCAQSAVFPDSQFRATIPLRKTRRNPLLPACGAKIPLLGLWCAEPGLI